MIEVGYRLHYVHNKSNIIFQDVKKPKDGDKPKKPKGPEPHKDQCICEMCTCGYVVKIRFFSFIDSIFFLLMSY